MLAGIETERGSHHYTTDKVQIQNVFANIIAGWISPAPRHLSQSGPAEIRARQHCKLLEGQNPANGNLSPLFLRDVCKLMLPRLEI